MTYGTEKDPIMIRNFHPLSSLKKILKNKKNQERMWLPDSFKLKPESPIFLRRMTFKYKSLRTSPGPEKVYTK